MKKGKFLNKPITKAQAVFLYSSFTFLILLIFVVNFFMNSYATLLNYAWGGVQLSAETTAAGMQLSAEIASEGTVLLKNEKLDASNANSEKILPLFIIA